MNQSTTVAIETQDLTKTYRGVQALKQLNLKVPEHSIFGFLGPNGAGKTTTIKLLLGLLRPTSGGGTIFGHDIARDSMEIRKRIGYLAQNPSYYEFMTARETLRFRAKFFYSGPESEIELRVAETLGLVGLEDKADRPIKGFSGGELQRLGIAQAQVNYPDLLILDEPAANLDPKGRRDVLDVMERLRKYTTIFYCTHILDDVQQVSDTVAILNHGELIAQAPMAELLAGSEGTIFSLIMEGDPSEAYARVVSQPWVSSIEAGSMNGRCTWQVAVTDEQAASAQLLRLVLSDPQMSVVEFGRKEYELEDVFLSIVEGAQNAER
ncbi:MAG: ABC transporter ATP-binding protein [Anaerolineales bacterium]|jgi:ABC-2 type transport system ATP-binding protein